MNQHRPHVVVLGGGFAGINTVLSLKKAPVHVTLIDRENHHLFQPLLYQVATGVLNPADIAYPLRRIFRKQANARVLLAEAKSVDLDIGEVVLDNGSIQFDYLVIATGARHAYFGNPGWEEVAPGLKSVEDALEIRRRILLAYEAAERESDPQRRSEWLRFVVVGAGPTGAEMAGAMAEIGRQAASDHARVHPDDVEVVLVEGQSHVLPGYVEPLSRAAQRQLEDLGVTVRTQSMVEAMDEDGLTLSGGEHIATKTIIWAAGVQGSSLAAELGVDLDRAGRVLVNADLTIPGHPTVFVAGDLAALDDVPGVAPAAIQQGKYVASAIRSKMRRTPVKAFVYHDKGSLATLGRAAAVADFGRVRFSGFFAWMAWLVIHIFFLVGFRNRVWVLSGWAWSYLAFQRGARLITGRKRHRKLPKVG